MLILLSAAVLAMAPASYSHADDFFSIDRPKLGLGASYEFIDEKRTIADIETKNTSHDWIETATIDTNGWAYHPNLMEYHLAFRPEWEQEKFKEWQTTDSTQTSKRDSSILAYDTSTTFLKQKPCSLDVFANRNTRKIDLSYAPDTDFDTKTWGSRLNFTNPTLPASLEYINKQSDQTGFYTSNEDRDQLQATIRNNLKYSTTELNVLHDETKRTTQSTSDTTNMQSNTTNAEFNNTYLFAGDDNLRLDSLLYMTQAKYDEVKIDSWLASENFFWTHDKNLLTQYTFNFNRHEVDDTDTEQKEIKALLTHHLDNALTTNLGAGVSLSDFAGGNQDLYDSNLGFLYHKPIPWGNIQLGAAYDYGVTNRNGTGSVIPTEERYALITGEQTLLQKENVVIESIVVTDVTNTIVYTKNIDYNVQEIGPSVEISRMLLGSITDGQQVIVRYSYRVDAGYNDARLGQDYRFDLDLWSFSYLTYRFRRLDQSILSGIPPTNRVDDTINSVLLRFVIKWSETRFSYEDQDRKNGNSTVTTSVNELINFRPFKYISLNFSGRVGNRDYTDTDQTEKFYTLGTDIGYSPTWWCTFSIVCIRNKISGDLQDMLNTEVTPTVRLAYGAWTASLCYRLMDQEDKDNSDSLYQQRIYCVVNRALW